MRMALRVHPKTSVARASRPCIHRRDGGATRVLGRTYIILILAFAPSGWALGQSSSLFKRSEERKSSEQAAATQPSSNGAMPANAGAAASRLSGRNRALAEVSLTAVQLPEPKIIKVNDLVGVIVRYRLKHQSKAKMEQESEWDVNSKLEAWFRLHDRKWTNQGFRAGTPEIDFKNKNELDNEGKFDRKDLLETRIMAKVIDVKPNGNLIIVGMSNITIDDEVQYVCLTGECNPADFSPDGNITSDKIFDLKVTTDNDGAIRDAVKRGWFKEILDTAKPF